MPSAKSSGSKSPSGKSGKVPKKDTRGSDEKIEEATFYDSSTYCLFCQRKFKTYADLQAHLLAMEHRDKRFLICRICGYIVDIDRCELHKCSQIKASFFKKLFSSDYLKYGPPNRCLLCNCAAAPSKSHLFLHLICAHSVNLSVDGCRICFKSLLNDSVDLDEECMNQASQNKNSKSKSNKTSPENSKKSAKSKSPNKTPKSGGSGNKASDKKGKNAQQNLDKIVECPGDYSNFQKSLAHINSNHRRYLLMENFKQAWFQSDTRLPFSCPMCLIVCQNNARFQAHILYCHGHTGDITNKLLTCVGCDLPFTSMQQLQHHVENVHTKEFAELGREWISQQLMQENVDPSAACNVCWQFFNSTSELQMHIVAKHVGAERMRCGICLYSFKYADNFDLAHKAFENHVKNHALEYRELAAALDLECGDNKKKQFPVGLTKEEYCSSKINIEELYVSDKSEKSPKSAKANKSKKSQGSKTKSK